jgi:hypothetical protein
VEWNKTFKSNGSSESMTKVFPTDDGGFFLYGHTPFSDSNDNLFAIKTNSAGDTLWTKHYGGGGYDGDAGARQTPDGGYILSGFSDSFSGSGDGILIKTNSTGAIEWSNGYGNTQTDNFRDAIPTADGGFIGTGGSSFDLFTTMGTAYLVKTDSLGNSGCAQSPLPIAVYTPAVAVSAIVFVPLAVTTTPVANTPLTVAPNVGVYATACTNIVTDLAPVKVSTAVVNVSPNPWSGQTTFTANLKAGEKGTLTVYDLMGRDVFTTILSNTNTPLFQNSLVSGFYRYRFAASGYNTANGSMVIQ